MHQKILSFSKARQAKQAVKTLAEPAEYREEDLEKTLGLVDAVLV